MVFVRHFFLPQGDEIVKHQHRQKLEKYDKYLKRFEHSKALDAAMDVSIYIEKPDVCSFSLHLLDVARVIASPWQ